ncbi:4'-phosphopantetheinyl transferase superfamily protein [Pelagicoccus sp. SDUM812002]|uniref:4'-phosphopantetheinyl transferase family protein n=1 Tax=Pelagicoccus sp. SDUM812002 TaxID=3041266 RepID=UPI00280C5A52|nr:4'-phosphopantetheinyl transferase superfamily protein [Pelagicoccus sp. SDUM812002]MDQ8185702.1 4'-phosphopantetheinyl transferase superfamily protein [Pelagicoccus sp. SDUM812002]
MSAIHSIESSIHVDHRDITHPQLYCKVSDGEHLCRAGADTVDLWIADLDSSIDQACISEAEYEASRRFHFPKDQQRSRNTRALTRLILSKYLNRSPEVLEFKRNDCGKPYLEGQDNRLRFNLSHGGGKLCIAVAWDCDLGVDLEVRRPIDDASDLVDRFFHPNEATRFRRLPKHLQLESFLRTWTAKEALLKATGIGLNADLSFSELTTYPLSPLRLLNVDPEWGHPQNWTLICPQVAPDLFLSLAVPRPVEGLKIFKVDGI